MTDLYPWHNQQPNCRTAFAEGLHIGLLAAVAPHVRLVWCAKGSTIIREGDSGDFMYIILSGECQLEKADRALPAPIDAGYTVAATW